MTDRPSDDSLSSSSSSSSSSTTTTIYGAPTWSDFFLQPGMLACATTACCIILYASFRTVDEDRYRLSHLGSHSSRGTANKADHATADEAAHHPLVILENRKALLFPLFGSLSLLLFFYFFDILSFVTSISVFLSSITSINFTALPIIKSFWPWPSLKRYQVPFFPDVQVSLLSILLFLGSLMIFFAWLMTGNVVLHNVLAVSMCIMFICFVRVPNLRVASILFGGLVIYDVFWVFYSARIFGKSVMVSVATKKAKNPVHTVAKAVHLKPPGSATPQLHLPMKIMWGSSMLGLGDIVLPGLILSYLLRFDVRKSSSARNGYFIAGMLGYSLGLVLAMVASFLTSRGQPALLYLFPCTLFPPIALASKRGELRGLWTHGNVEEDLVDDGFAQNPDVVDM